MSLVARALAWLVERVPQAPEMGSHSTAGDDQLGTARGDGLDAIGRRLGVRRRVSFRSDRLVAGQVERVNDTEGDESYRVNLRHALPQRRADAQRRIDARARNGATAPRVV